MVRKVIGVNDRGYRVGESHHRAKLSNSEVETILYLRDQGLSCAQIAAKWDEPGGVRISKSTVRDICSGAIRGQHPSRIRRG